VSARQNYSPSKSQNANNNNGYIRQVWINSCHNKEFEIAEAVTLTGSCIIIHESCCGRDTEVLAQTNLEI
jgi:hypothetical protein